AFAEELHHRSEHSIELASVWLHHVRQGRDIEIAPILCGSFAHFVAGEADPAHDLQIEGTIAALRQVTVGRNVLVVAAADLAHVGPAFGGPPFGLPGRAELRRTDEELLAMVAGGDAGGFYALLRSTGDRNNVCGLPPIYLALRFLGNARGETIAYDQCTADEADTSWVSVAGMVWR
ncbi:MAG: AmmeMemoRadiSam system protein B, partial [Chloroflexi bacterium]|nr:AmmeMemoRadiSam system protein B [Chloroflexota bacterium]